MNTSGLTLRKMVLCVLIFAPLCSSGCMGKTKTVYIKHGEPVRLRKTIKNAEIWAADKDGKDVPGVIDLPEGWYALPK